MTMWPGQFTVSDRRRVGVGYADPLRTISFQDDVDGEKGVLTHMLRARDLPLIGNQSVVWPVAKPQGGVRVLNGLCPFWRTAGRAMYTWRPLPPAALFSHGCLANRRRESAMLIFRLLSWRLRQAAPSPSSCMT